MCYWRIHTHTHTHTKYSKYFGLIQGFSKYFLENSKQVDRLTSTQERNKLVYWSTRLHVNLKYACVNVRGISGCDSRGHLPPAPSARGGARGSILVNSEQSTVNRINVGAKHRSAKCRRAKNLSPAISNIYGAMFIAPYKAITTLVSTRDDNNRPPQSPEGGSMVSSPIDRNNIRSPKPPLRGGLEGLKQTIYSPCFLFSPLRGSQRGLLFFIT
ncbi:hypothetical protein D0T66_03980 [Dysgonomonas sp. 25]|nr:hypothetical protein [Dysgonomonas sp. 25]